MLMRPALDRQYQADSQPENPTTLIKTHVRKDFHRSHVMYPLE
jgi:hypothetical protein